MTERRGFGDMTDEEFLKKKTKILHRMNKLDMGVVLLPVN